MSYLQFYFNKCNTEFDGNVSVAYYRTSSQVLLVKFGMWRDFATGRGSDAS